MPFRPDENTVEVPAAYCGVADDVRNVVRKQLKLEVTGLKVINVENLADAQQGPTDVRKVVRKQVRAYVRGAPWREALHGPMVSTRDVRGLIYLDGPAFSGLPLTPQIFLYMPYLEAYRHIERGELAPSSVDEL